MAPLVWALAEHGPALGIETTVLSTKQHKDLVSKFLSLFGVTIDVEMDIPDSKHRTLASLTANVVQAAQKVISEHTPDIVLVQGDTTSAMALAMTAFYNRIPVGHVEAGLRTYDLEQPFPEEMNRQVISRMASLHFTPTKLSACALLAEGAAPDQVVLTGNTVIDTFKWTLSRVLGSSSPGSPSAAKGSKNGDSASDTASATDGNAPPDSSAFVSGVHKHVELAFGAASPLLMLLTEIGGADIGADDTSMARFTSKAGDRVVLLTVHRRENHGEPLEGICDAVLQLAHERPDVHFVYPVHPNPKVGETVRPRLGAVPNVHLIEPLEYDALVFLMSKSTLVLTDSGGLQEEATYLARPVLVMRRATERLEGVLAGAADLVGTDTQDIINSVNLVLDNVGGKYDAMAKRTLPYGDGKANIRTVHALAAFKAEILASGPKASGRPLHEGALTAPGIGASTAAAAAMGCPALLQAMADNAHAAGSKSTSLRASQ
jgi:UDP-N-acetylglucosamine 2-epimerase (non-hydrolysing)